MQADKALQIFSYEGGELRTVTDEHGDPWWVAVDVCQILEIANSRDAVDRLDDDEKLMSEIATSGQRRKMRCINESGLYHLIFTSQKEEAKKFRRWVTDEVLPSIRKTGSYSIQPEPQRGPNHEISDRIARTYDFLEARIVKGYWAIITETHREVRIAELLGQLDGGAFPEKSVGRMWAKYARETLHIDVDNLPTYLHCEPDAKKVRDFPALSYPMSCLPDFRVWFSDIYLPNHCPVYVANRKKRLERQARIANSVTPQLIEGRK